MAALSTTANANLLNWLLGGATVAANTLGTAAVEVSAGSPTAVSASPIPTATIASRQLASFGAVAAGAPATGSNSLAMTFSAVSGCTVSGLTIWAATGTQGAAGTMWAYGLLATARTLGAGDSLVFAVGSCQVTLS